MRSSSGVVFAGLSALGALLCTGTSRADEDSLRLMREPIPYTDVADAADGDDPFDLNAHVGFQRRTDTGTIQRETTSADGRGRIDIAKSKQAASILHAQLDIGLYHDLMAYMRLPLILSDARELNAVSNAKAAESALQEPGDYGGTTGPLFSVPFTSPTRAGFDYIAFGGEWGILNQQRDPYVPTWVLLVEGRRAIGSPLKPCIEEAGATTCGTRGDRNGDGEVDQGSALQLDGQRAGSSKGLSGITAETRASFRYRYLEPYVGTGFSIDWPSTARKYFLPGGDLSGRINKLPSRQTWAVIGTQVIPWENRGRYQRFAIDLRLDGTWLSEGHDYSHLYDALGTSTHQGLAAPQYEGYDAATGEPVTKQKVPFYGLTDIQSRMRYGFRVGLEMQAARYVRFAFGTALHRVTNHAITFADPCNPNVSDPARRVSSTGNVCDPGVVNPAQRAVIDAPGRRFWMVGETLFDLYATATAQF